MSGTSRTPHHRRGPSEKGNEALLLGAGIVALILWLGWYYDLPVIGWCLDLAGTCLYPSYLRVLPGSLLGVLRDSRVFMALVDVATALCGYLLGVPILSERLRRWYEDQDERRRRCVAARQHAARDRIERRNRSSNRAPIAAFPVNTSNYVYTDLIGKY